MKIVFIFCLCVAFDIALYYGWRRVSAYNKYIEAEERLRQWQAARPFLYIGQCEYAQSLVFVMIDAYKLLLIYEDWRDIEILTNLHELLDEQPPSHDPPPLRETVGAVSLLCAI